MVCKRLLIRGLFHANSFISIAPVERFVIRRTDAKYSYSDIDKGFGIF